MPKSTEYRVQHVPDLYWVVSCIIFGDKYGHNFDQIMNRETSVAPFSNQDFGVNVVIYELAPWSVCLVKGRWVVVSEESWVCRSQKLGVSKPSSWIVMLTHAADCISALWCSSLRAHLIWADAKFKLENTSTNPNPNLDVPTVFPLEQWTLVLLFSNNYGLQRQEKGCWLFRFGYHRSSNAS